MTEATIEKTIIEEKTEREKPYHFRRLKADDVPAMLRIVKKVGLKEFKALLSGEFIKEIVSKYAAALFGGKKEKKEAKDEVENAMGDLAVAGIMSTIDIVEIILDNFFKIENDIFSFLARISDLDEQGVRDLDMVDFAEMLKDFLEKEEFPDFFKVVSKLYK